METLWAVLLLLCRAWFIPRDGSKEVENCKNRVGRNLGGFKVCPALVAVRVSALMDSALSLPGCFL